MGPKNVCGYPAWKSVHSLMFYLQRSPSCTQCEGYGNRRLTEACSDRPLASHSGGSGRQGCWAAGGQPESGNSGTVGMTGSRQCTPAGFLQEAWHSRGEQTPEPWCTEAQQGTGSEARQPHDRPTFLSPAEVGSSTLLPFAATDFFFKASLSKISLPIF